MHLHLHLHLHKETTAHRFTAPTRNNANLPTRSVTTDNCVVVDRRNQPRNKTTGKLNIYV